MIRNPILKGFCPDPSIIRVGQDYYIATSTFEWWPGVRLFHSKDLQHWEQIPSPLRRESQLDLIGDPTSGGVWAPCLSYDGERFFLVYTDAKTKKGRFYNTHNYLVHTDDIYGEWSDPVYLNSIGFDPSLFHDTDGKKYLINMVNGFKGVLVQELDAGYHLTGPRRKVYDGSGIKCTEGPHMYHIGEWYYLIVAEGGTGYDHCVTMARARTVWGPFETAPGNPILTSDRENMDSLQKCGHADIVETQDGEWYMVHLCSRPLNGEKWCILGRETAIQKMVWDRDGWLRLKAGGRFAGNETEAPAGIREVFLEDEETGFFDDFDESGLHVRYNSPRIDYNTFADCTARKGWVRITGRESLNSLHRVSLLGVRQRQISCKVETRMDFAPEYPEQMAGLAYLYDAMNFYILGKTATEDGQEALTLIKSDTGVISDEMEPVPVPCGESIWLRAEVAEDGMSVIFRYSLNGVDWQQAGGEQTTRILTDEHCKGFTGAHFGLYCHDMAGLSKAADFEYFTIGEVM
ncbi:MAG: glycoside hydrolase family 43 protein [Lachnospiraceae bacterium]|nr:glycoside hydrolase family 43 protein [Butyrivibrio sp.]MCM1342984.1 glycoside hydrolase family 43 protein [Muribaculaceae bacterium]MCM1410714.1 glycoside hydrolase family 43 protein [Lachnospiraceae bacterium]